MRTTLLSAVLAGLFALAALPAAAAEGPGREPARLQAVITADYDGRWDGRWQDPNGDVYHRDWNRDRYGYNQPNWGWGNFGNWWGFNRYRQPLPERVIRRHIASQHFHDIGGLKLKDGYYRANAENWRGQDVRLIVDAYTGRVLDVDRR